MWWFALMRRQNPVDCCSVNPEKSDQKINDGFKRRIEDFCTQVALKLAAQVSAVLFFLLVCTMYGLCCGYEWDLFTLLVTMWLTLPRPFAGRFHGICWAWNSALVVKLVCRSWNGAFGGCVPLTGSQLSALAFFGHGSSLESMWLTVMSTERLF